MKFDFELDSEAFEKEQKWREVKNKWVPLIIGLRINGYSRKEVHNYLHFLFQHGDIEPSEYLILEPEANKSFTIYNSK